MNAGDRIVTAWAERCHGPGWSNPIVWLLVRDAAGKLRIDGVQPNEQSEGMLTLHGVAAKMHETMLTHARIWAEGR